VVGKKSVIIRSAILVEVIAVMRELKLLNNLNLAVMLSLLKHLYRQINSNHQVYTTAVEMLRPAQHDGLTNS
jgi:hypothetical protein